MNSISTDNTKLSSSDSTITGVLESSLDTSNFGPVISLHEMHFYAEVFKLKAREGSMQLHTPNMCIIDIYYIAYMQQTVLYNTEYRGKNKKILHPCASFRRNCSEI